MKIYMIRHGMTIANEQKLYCGQTDVSLTENGKKELEEKGQTFSYPDLKGLKVYTSGLLRTEQTLQALFGEVDHTPLPDFMEINFGDFEMHSYQELQFDGEFIDWCTGDNEANIPPGEGAESGYMMQDRVFKAFDELVSKGEDCLIVSHGGPITAIYQRLNPNDPLNWYELQPKNGEGFLFEFDENKKYLRTTRIPEKR